MGGVFGQFTVLTVIMKIVIVLQLARLDYSIAAAVENEDDNRCLQSLQDVRKAFLGQKYDSHTSPHSNTIFSLFPKNVRSYTIDAVYYSVRVEDRQYNISSETSALLSSSSLSQHSGDPMFCCDLNNPDTCLVFLRFRSKFYKEISPPLLVLSAFPFAPKELFFALINTTNNRYIDYMKRFGIRKYCWNVPPLCDDSKTLTNMYEILKAFTGELPHLVMNGMEGPIQIGPVRGYDPRADSWAAVSDKMKALTFGDVRASVALLIILSFVLTVPLVLMLISWYKEVIRVVLVKSQLAAECVYTAMILFWLWFVYLQIHSIFTIRGQFVHLSGIKRSDVLMYSMTMQDTVVHVISFAIISVITAIEVLPMLMYFWRSPMVRRVYGATHTRGHLQKARNLLECLGWLGIILMCQHWVVLMAYDGIFLFINPLYTTMQVLLNILFVFMSAVATLGFGVSIFTCCRTCTFSKCIKLFVLTFSIMTIFCICYLMREITDSRFDQDDSTTMLGVATSVISSGALAAFGYFCKKAIWGKVLEEVQEFDFRHDACEAVRRPQTLPFEPSSSLQPQHPLTVELRSLTPVNPFRTAAIH